MLAGALLALTGCDGGADDTTPGEQPAPELGGGSTDGTTPDVGGGIDEPDEREPLAEGPCASCADHEECIDDKCIPEWCPPGEPHGTLPADMLTNVTVYDCDDQPYELHALCGANVGFFNLLAGW